MANQPRLVYTIQTNSFDSVPSKISSILALHYCTFWFFFLLFPPDGGSWDEHDFGVRIFLFFLISRKQQKTYDSSYVGTNLGTTDRQAEKMS